MRRLLVPETATALAEALAEAAHEGVAVELQGLGARSAWGNPLPEDRIGLSTSRLARVLDYAPDDMVVTAEAGVTLADLNGLLAARGQVLPLEVPFPERTTLGGLVGAAPVPLARSAHGLVRDWLLGFEAATTEGARVKGGARVVKSVAGYDLCKLYAGSLGTLGAIATVTFRVRPRPETQALLCARWPGAAEADVALAAIQTTTLDPALAIMRAGTDLTALVLGFEGSSETVAWQAAEARRLLGELGGTLDETLWGPEAAGPRARLRDALAGSPEAPLVARVSVLPSELTRFIAEAQERAIALGVACEAIAQVQQGTLWLSASGGDWVEWGEALRARAHAHGGSLVLERCPDPGLMDAFGLDGLPLALMRRLKASLDPSGCLAPGRMWPATVE